MTDLLVAWLPALLVVLPLVAAMAAFVRLFSARQQVLLVLPLLALANLAAWYAVDTEWLMGGWALPVGIRWALTPTSLAFISLTTVIMSVGSLATSRFHSAEQQEYWTLWWLVWAALNTLWLTRDLFNAYVALELLTLCATGLIASSRKDPLGFAALRYLFIALIASLLYLLGVGLLYGLHARLDIDTLTSLVEQDFPHALAALCLSLGLMMKAAIVPLHSWLPQAHSRAEPQVSAVLSALVVAVPIYWLWLLWQGPLRVFSSEVFFLATGIVSLLWGGLAALQQTQLKRLIAYSTVSQMGYALMLLGLPLTDESQLLAHQGALTLIVAHGLAKAGLFLCAGQLAERHGSDHLQALTGSAYRYPWRWLAFGLCALSLIGLPPSAGFTGKWWLFSALWQTQPPWVAVGFLLGTLLTAAYFIKVMRLALHRPADWQGVSQRVSDASSAPLLCLALAVWGLGILLLRHEFSWPGVDSTSAFFIFPALLIWTLVLVWQPGQRLGRLLWVCAGLHLLALTAQDWLTFYTALAWLGFLGWLLIRESRTPQAKRAADVYLAFMLIAEVLLFAGLASLPMGQLGLGQHSLASVSLSTALLLAAGMAIKAGSLGVHQWLPVAHPSAPPLASAVLSGLLIKLGILGMLRLIPADMEVAVSVGGGVFYWGMAAAVYAGMQGVRSHSPKAVLAWSSVGQIGLLTAGVGLLLLAPSHTALRNALLLLVVTHGLAKAALFIGVWQWPKASSTHRTYLAMGLLVAALSLVGAPLSGGLYIKGWLETAAQQQGLYYPLSTLASLATALLMLRCAYLLSHDKPSHDTPSTRMQPFSQQRLWGWASLCLGAWALPWYWQFSVPYPGDLGNANLKGLGIMVGATTLALAVKHLSPRMLARQHGRRFADLPDLASQSALALAHQCAVKQLGIERKLRHWGWIGSMLALLASMLLWLIHGVQE